MIAAFIPILWFFPDASTPARHDAPDPETIRWARAIILFSLKSLLAQAACAVKAGSTAPSRSWSFTRTPYRLYFRGTGEELGLVGIPDSARALYFANNARFRLPPERKLLLGRDGWWINVNIIRLRLQNIGMVSGILPVVGVLPRRYGGSALIVLMAVFGIAGCRSTTRFQKNVVEKRI